MGRRITGAIRLYLDVTWFLCVLVSIVALPTVLIAVAALAFGYGPSNRSTVPVRLALEGEPRLEIPPNVTFESDPEDLPDFFKQPPILERGSGRFFVRSPSRASWAIHATLFQLKLFVWIFVTARLRELFDSVAEGHAFDPENAVGIRKAGLAIVGWSVIGPLLQLGAAFVLLRGVEIEGFVVRPSFDFRLSLTFAGLAVVVLAELFRQAAALERERRLTI